MNQLMKAQSRWSFQVNLISKLSPRCILHGILATDITDEIITVRLTITKIFNKQKILIYGIPPPQLKETSKPSNLHEHADDHIKD